MAAPNLNPPLCQHYLPSGECRQLPTVTMPVVLLPGKSAGGGNAVHEYCPHGGPSLPAWHWNQPTCAMYVPVTPGEGDGARRD